MGRANLLLHRFFVRVHAGERRILIIDCTLAVFCLAPTLLVVDMQCAQSATARGGEVDEVGLAE